VGSLQEPLHKILDMEKFQQLPANIIDTNIPETRHLTFVRHEESKYNEYKKKILSNPDYQEFMNTPNIPKNSNIFIYLLYAFL
jgi:hypothetical protein